MDPAATIQRCERCGRLKWVRDGVCPICVTSFEARLQRVEETVSRAGGKAELTLAQAAALVKCLSKAPALDAYLNGQIGWPRSDDFRDWHSETIRHFLHCKLVWPSDDDFDRVRDAGKEVLEWIQKCLNLVLEERDGTEPRT